MLLLMQAINSGRPTNCWNGLRPLHSTCEDVKRILKVDNCSAPPSQYTLPDFRVMVEFENETCDRNPRAWRVPSGTVTGIIISPTKEMLPSEFGIDLSSYQRREDGEIVGKEHYENRDEGVSLELYRGFIQNLFLRPQASEEKLRCKPLKLHHAEFIVSAVRG